MKELVVFGLIHQNKFLALRRPPDHINEPGSLTLPAGHVEDGETPEEAVRRELKEEFDIVHFDLELLKGPYAHSSITNRKYCVYFYVIKNWDGEFKNVEDQDVFFLDLNSENIDLVEIESSREILHGYISQINCV